MKYKTFLMFWRSFNLTFKANLFDEILMQPQKKLFFGFLFRALWKTWLVHSNFSWFPAPTIHLQYEDFASHSKNQPFLELFLAYFKQQKSFSLQSKDKNSKGQSPFFNEQKSFFRTTTELTILTATLQCVLQPS